MLQIYNTFKIYWAKYSKLAHINEKPNITTPFIINN